MGGERCTGIFLQELFVLVGGFFGWLLFGWGVAGREGVCVCIFSPQPRPCLTQQSCQIRFCNFQPSILNVNVSHHILAQNSNQC